MSAGLYTAGWRLTGLVPEPVALRLAELGGTLAARRGGPGVRQLRRNLARVAPGADLDTLVPAALRSYARYWSEVFRLPAMDRATVVGRAHVDGEDRLRAAHATGDGVVLALPHMGNYDHAGAWATMTGMPLTTVAERLQPSELFDRFVDFRRSLGMEVLPLTGGADPPYQLLSDRLRSGRLLALVSDREIGPGGVPVSFFGATARMPAGPAALALRTGAPLLPVTCWYDGPRWRMRIHPQVPTTSIRAMTQSVADAFAEGIAAHPADWHMLQRVWVEP